MRWLMTIMLNDISILMISILCSSILTTIVYDRWFNTATFIRAVLRSVHVFTTWSLWFNLCLWCFSTVRCNCIHETPVWMLFRNGLLQSTACRKETYNDRFKLRSLTHPFIYALIHSLVRSLAHPLTHCHPPICPNLPVLIMGKLCNTNSARHVNLSIIRRTTELQPLPVKQI